MPFPLIGEIAAVLTSVFFSIGPTFFTLAGQLVGSVVVNRTRLLIAFPVLLLIHWLLLGTPLPLDADGDRWLWLGISGVIGFTLGDAALFQAFVMLGTRLTMLIFSLSPIIAAFTAWIFLGESLSVAQIMGISVTIMGVVWVVTERNNKEVTKRDKSLYWRGMLFAVVGAAGQALGIVTAKKGLWGDFPTLSALVIRLAAGTISIWIITLFQGQVKDTFKQLKEKPAALRFTFWGAVFGPITGVWLSLIAIQFSSVGVASTLMALPPIFLLPIGYYVFKERISPRAIAGTIIALAGVVVLFSV